MSMGDEEEEDEKVFYLVSNISKDNITAHSSFLNTTGCVQRIYCARKAFSDLYI